MAASWGMADRWGDCDFVGGLSRNFALGREIRVSIEIYGIFRKGVLDDEEVSSR